MTEKIKVRESSGTLGFVIGGIIIAPIAVRAPSISHNPRNISGKCFWEQTYKRGCQLLLCVKREKHV